MQTQMHNNTNIDIYRSIAD